jgi:hypothetical protein
MVINMKMAVFWDAAPCGLGDTDQHFRGANCLHHQGTSEMSVSIYQTTWNNIPEDSHLQPTLWSFYRHQAEDEGLGATLTDIGTFDSCKYLMNQSKYSEISSSSLTNLGRYPRTAIGKVDSCSVC